MRRGEHELMAQPRILRLVRITSESGAEVDEVVFDERNSIFFNHHIIGIAGAGVRIVQPGEDGIQAAKVAPVLVENRIVRIVVTHVFVIERADRFAFDLQTGHQPQRTIVVVRNFLDDIFKVPARHLPVRAVSGGNFSLF